MKKFFNQKLSSELLCQITNGIGEIIKTNFQNYSINGCIMYNNTKCFFKIVDCDCFVKEISGYFACNNILPIKNIVFTRKLFGDMYIIIYEYDETITDCSGLLNDVLVSNDVNNAISKEDSTQINNVLLTYDNIYSQDLIYLEKSSNDIFFRERINSRLKKWYKNLINSNKVIKINDKLTVSTNNILNETINYFENSNNLKACVLTQGDPNTLNISTKPLFFDLVTAGYNSIVSEVAITIISTLLYDNYFCPRYHPNSYGTHVEAVNNYNLFKPNLLFKENKHELLIYSNIVTSTIRKKYILDYINILKKNNIIIDSTIKYYIVMRLMCVFNINKMSKNDYYYSLFLMCYFYVSIGDDFYNSIVNIINEMEELKNDK